jgi:Zn-dependent membrane protease YugP
VIRRMMNLFGMYPYYFDPTYVILLPAIIISMIAQAKISSAFNKYSIVPSMRGITADEVARRILNSNGLFDIPVELVAGNLTDHYDPTNRVLRLSQSVYASTSIAAIGVAAHEAGHALQHKESYMPLIFRNSIVPIVNFGSKASWVLFALGLFMRSGALLQLGIIFFSAAVIFQIVTLPVEFNASNRALNILENSGILYDEELRGAKKVLSAAAMTYVAAALMSILQLVRLIAISRRNDD